MGVWASDLPELSDAFDRSEPLCRSLERRMSNAERIPNEHWTLNTARAVLRERQTERVTRVC